MYVWCYVCTHDVMNIVYICMYVCMLILCMFGVCMYLFCMYVYICMYMYVCTYLQFSPALHVDGFRVGGGLQGQGDVVLDFSPEPVLDHR